MRKFVAVVIVVGIGLIPVFTGAVMAQKAHAPKAVWKAMVASLHDIQGVTASLTVFDMERATMFADQLVARETFISKMEALPKEVREGHAKVAKAATELAAATRSGEEQEIATKIGAVIGACSACHYDLRDAERRKNLQ